VLPSPGPRRRFDGVPQVLAVSGSASPLSAADRCGAGPASSNAGGRAALSLERPGAELAASPNVPLARFARRPQRDAAQRTRSAGSAHRVDADRAGRPGHGPRAGAPRRRPPAGAALRRAGRRTAARASGATPAAVGWRHLQPCHAAARTEGAARGRAPGSRRTAVPRDLSRAAPGAARDRTQGRPDGPARLFRQGAARHGRRSSHHFPKRQETRP
jgi:hypothetical protein